MSLKTPSYNPPHPYPQRGMYRDVRRLPKEQRGRRKGTRRGVKGMFARERGMEQAFKFGQIRSGLEGITTFRQHTERKPSREQVVSDFYKIHAKTIQNKERDENDIEFMKSNPKLADWSERTAEAIKEKKEDKARVLRLEDRKQSFFEKNADSQLQLQRDALDQQFQITRDARMDRARLEHTLGEAFNTHFRNQEQRDYRTGERDARLFSIVESLGQRFAPTDFHQGVSDRRPSVPFRRPSVASTTSSDDPQIEEITPEPELLPRPAMPPISRDLSGGGSPSRNYSEFESVDEGVRKDLHKLSLHRRRLQGKLDESTARQQEIVGGVSPRLGAPKGLTDVGGFLQTEEAQPTSLLGTLKKAFSPRQSPAEKELTQAQSDKLLEVSEERRKIHSQKAQLDDDERLLRQSANLKPVKSEGLSQTLTGIFSPRPQEETSDWGGSEKSLSMIKAEAEKEEQVRRAKSVTPSRKEFEKARQELRRLTPEVPSRTLTPPIPQTPAPRTEPPPPSPQERSKTILQELQLELGEEHSKTLARLAQEKFETSVRAGGRTPTLRPPAGGVVEDVEEVTETGAGTGLQDVLLENVNPIEDLPQGFRAEGNDKDGWKPTQYKVKDVDGVIGKKQKGVEYYVVKKDKKNVSIVDITNPQLKNWNNVGIGRFDKLIKGGKISM